MVNRQLSKDDMRSYLERSFEVALIANDHLSSCLNTTVFDREKLTFQKNPLSLIELKKRYDFLLELIEREDRSYIEQLHYEVLKAVIVKSLEIDSIGRANLERIKALAESRGYKIPSSSDTFKKNIFALDFRLLLLLVEKLGCKDSIKSMFYVFYYSSLAEIVESEEKDSLYSELPIKDFIEWAKRESKIKKKPLTKESKEEFEVISQMALYYGPLLLSGKSPGRAEFIPFALGIGKFNGISASHFLDENFKDNTVIKTIHNLSEIEYEIETVTEITHNCDFERKSVRDSLFFFLEHTGL